MKKNKIIALVVLFIIVIFSIVVGLVIYNRKSDTSTEVLDMVSSIETNAKTKIDGVNWSGYEEIKVSLDDSYTITKSGIYYLSGEIEDGMITVNAEDSNVKLVLDNLNITNSKGPAIYVIKASHVEIETSDESVNTLVDGSTYSDFSEDDKVNATIFSKSDLILSGTGRLIVTANYNDGITSKDNLKITGGTIEVTSVGDGIKGKDSVEVNDGNIIINSKQDGIKSTITNKAKKGYIYITGGNFNIISSNDAFQAETDIYVTGGTFNIVTGGGSASASSSSSWGIWGKDETSSSAKGFKSSTNVILLNGTYNIDSADDSIHSTNYLGIANGTYTINSGDDGIHADSEVIIDNGTVNIEKCNEGIEAQNIIINDGNIKLVSSDDGINVNGGTNEEVPGMMNANQSSSSDNDNSLVINGGTIYVNSKGDGLDSNGSIYITGGSITVEGPTDDGNGPLDYNLELKITGGILIATGSSGMAQNASESSTQNSVIVYFSSTKEANSTVTVTDDDGNEVFNLTPSKSYECIVISSDKLKTGSTYKVVSGDETISFTVSSTITSAGNNGMNRNNNQNRRGARR